LEEKERKKHKNKREIIAIGEERDKTNKKIFLRVLIITRYSKKAEQIRHYFFGFNSRFTFLSYSLK